MVSSICELFAQACRYYTKVVFRAMTFGNRSVAWSNGRKAATSVVLAALVLSVMQSRPAAAATTSVILSLSRYSKVGQLPAGQFAGVFPGRVVIRVGDSVTFVNADSRHHTATGLVGTKEFPDDPAWTDAALHASGKLGAGEWSTGDLPPGGHSAPVVAVKPGVYLYGCFYDYSAGMRGEIVVEP